MINAHNNYLMIETTFFWKSGVTPYRLDFPGYDKVQCSHDYILCITQGINSPR
jgi:hypothetical protein